MHDISKLLILGYIESDVTKLDDEWITFILSATRKIRWKEVALNLEVVAYDNVAKFALTLKKWERIYIESSLVIEKDRVYAYAFDITSLARTRKPVTNQLHQFEDLP